MAEAAYRTSTNILQCVPYHLTQEQLYDATKYQFICANKEKSEKTRTRLDDIIAAEESKLQFDKSKARPLPKQSATQSVPIKLNAATIMREGALYQKREEKEMKK